MKRCLKTLILLAFASIAIHYTAIQILAFEPFSLFQRPSHEGSSLRNQNEPPFEGRAAGGGGCNDTNSSLKTSGKTYVLVLAATRSGSSFLAQLLNQHSDVFYLYEPLYHVHKTLVPKIPQINTSGDRRSMSGAGLDLLRTLYRCDLYSLENYIRPVPKAHVTSALFRRGASRVLCHQPVCNVNGTADVHLTERECNSKCGPLNLTLANEACRQMKYVVIKIVRLGDINEVRALVEDPQLNLKVIQLVRDPRGVLSSRLAAFGSPDRQLVIWKNTGKRPDDINLKQVNGVCEDYYSSVSTALSLPEWLKGKYMLVRYEDLARKPFEKTKEIYGFLGLSLEEYMKDWLTKHTQSNNTAKTRQTFGTVRDSNANAENWRLELSYDIAEYIQTVCQKTFHQLGYKAVKSEAELKNVSLSLVEDKTFLPFL